MSDESMTGVLAGRVDPDLAWLVVAGGSDEQFYTMLEIYRDGQRLTGPGLTGPKLAPGQVVEKCHDTGDGLPHFVLVRTAPEVDRVVAITGTGREVELTLSAVIEDFGLRFGAVALPEGEVPGSMRVERDGVAVVLAPDPGTDLRAPDVR
ncbi:hypothetical protein ABIB25_002691 [Nakamurella sp. UYEF19]|uniref:hypothetical protein n=1 Tax=Nakamurella sp. UYEF19 TaxID=1756392 RepID=UPI0033963667